MPAHLVKVKSIGKGSFGVVWLVRSGTGEMLVMKEVSLRGLPPKEQRATWNEVKVLSKLEHPNIISYRESYINIDKVCAFAVVSRTRSFGQKTLLQRTCVLLWCDFGALANSWRQLGASKCYVLCAVNYVFVCSACARACHSQCAL
eukprot:6178688-Pleurochrysis_carterae.AAC.2